MTGLGDMAQSDFKDPQRKDVAGLAKRFSEWNPPKLLAGLITLMGLGLVPVIIHDIFKDYGAMGLLYFAVSIVALVLLIILATRFKHVERAVALFFGAWIVFAVWTVFTLAPMLAFLAFAQYFLTKFSFWFQVMTFAMWGLLLSYALALIATARSREWLFGILQNAGGFAPVVYSLNVSAIAITFFSSLTYFLSTQGMLELAAPGGKQVTWARLWEFFLWHFLEDIPALKVNQTLRWDEPWTHDSASVGWILLLFKLAVIVPVIGAFVGYWGLPSTKDKAKGQETQTGKQT